jgi:tetratricopeptide (TPR) repeat protein
VAALWAGTLLAYSNSFRAGLVFDNNELILQYSRIAAATPHNVRLILTREYWHKVSGNGLYRPIATLSYLFNRAILGSGSNPASYHWVNFGLHALNILLVYLLGLILLRKTALAFALAAVWALHPLLTESVTNVVGRPDLLAGFGVLAGLLCHIKGTAASGWSKRGWLFALIAVTAIGLFSKESAVVVLAAMAIYDFTFWTAASWRDRVAGYLAVALPFLAFLCVREKVLGGLVFLHVPFTDNPLVGSGFWTSRITAVKVVGKCLGLLVWPARLSCDYSYNEIPLFSWRFDNWEDWKALIALAACTAAAVLAFRCYRRHKAIFFFIALFFATLLPTSNLVVFVGSIMAERFLYLPSIGFAGCLVVAIYSVCQRLPARWRRAAATAAVTLTCVAFASRTYARNLDWRDEQSLWASAAEACPGSYKTHMGAASGQPLDSATSELDRSLAILDSLPDIQDTPVPYINAGGLYRDKGDALSRSPSGKTPAAIAQSIYWYRKSLDLLLRAERIQLAYNQERRREDLLRGRTPSDTVWFQLYPEMGVVYLRLSEFGKAVEALRKARQQQLEPELFEELSAGYRGMGDPRQAAITLIEGLVTDPTDPRFAPELVELYKQTDPQGCAIRNTGGTVSLNLECPLVHDQVCEASRNMERFFLQTGQPGLASRTRRTAESDLACPAGSLN